MTGIGMRFAFVSVRRRPVLLPACTLSEEKAMSAVSPRSQMLVKTR
jgi:hypothetical protein